MVEISDKNFKKFYNLASNIYNTSIVLVDFCLYHDDIEETQNLCPTAIYLKDESDKLLYNFMNIKIEQEETL